MNWGSLPFLRILLFLVSGIVMGWYARGFSHPKLMTCLLVSASVLITLILLIQIWQNTFLEPQMARRNCKRVDLFSPFIEPDCISNEEPGNISRWLPGIFLWNPDFRTGEKFKVGKDDSKSKGDRHEYNVNIKHQGVGLLLSINPR